VIADPDKPEELSADEVLAELRAAGIPLTAGNLQAMIEAARSAKTEAPHAVEMFVLKSVLPSSCSYETARRAAVSGALRATRIAGRWFCSREDVQRWLAEKPAYWFTDEGALLSWRAALAKLKPKWIV